MLQKNPGVEFQETGVVLEKSQKKAIRINQLTAAIA
jgi:hypothetical protein